TTLPRVTVGDFRGGNTGWAVTAASSDLLGTVPAVCLPAVPCSASTTNIIPAFDVWASNAQCDLSTIDGVDEMGADLPIGYGTITLGTDDTPDAATESLMTDGSQTVCALGTDTDGRAAGIF